MNDKDKEAFERFVEKDSLSQMEHRLFLIMSENQRIMFTAERSWQAACEYKEKSLINGTRMKQMNEEIERLKAENAKLWDTILILKEGLEFYSDPENDNPDNFYNNEQALEILKELEDK